MAIISEDVIEDLEDGLRMQYEYIEKIDSEDIRLRYIAQLRDDTILIANVVHKHNLHYDMDEFFRRSGYTGIAPRYN